MSKDNVTEEELFENEDNGSEEEEEMELELDGDEIEGEMEELVAENVAKAEKQHKEQKHKRGPKPGSKKKTSDDKEAKPKKSKEADLNNPQIVQREIKKGRLSSPQGRIEKTDEGYRLMIAEGVILRDDVKEFKEFAVVSKMQEGKSLVFLKAAEMLGTETFKGITHDGKEKEHGFVRVELHKPGREKDVVELYNAAFANSEKKKMEEKEKRKLEAAEKAAKKKEEEEKAAEDNKEETAK